ncbi:hypothetical protein ACSBOB_00955 [Mesorhizobium sp. ASY16-5R]|uniref:hypothetical protein n=1 Tax=Mesorhizobium sp. ASY16-5R TaxID=3445772 RepID=UPI003F9F21A1
MAKLVSYRGWIPTVNGRLSFKIIGECRHPSAAQYANLGTASYQYVIALQRRQTTDVLFPRLLSRFFQVSGDFKFVFCARSRRGARSVDDPLIGRIYVMRPGSEGYLKIDGLFSAWLPVFRTAEDSPDEYTIANYKIIHDELSALTDFSANAVIHRNGMTTISRVAFSDDEIYDNSERFAAAEKVNIDAIWADQLYFFLRDISHQHQHHSPDADTMITTYRVEGRTLEWCSRVVYALYFYIINSKRRLEPTEQVRVLGVLAYLSSFKTIAEEQSKRQGLPLDIPQFNDQATKDSINATKGYLDLKFSERKQNSDKFRTVLFTVTATLLTLINFVNGFADPNVETEEWIKSFANLIKENAWVCVFPPLIIGVWWISDLILIPNYEAKRDAVRLTFSNRWLFGTLIVVLAAGAFFVAWWLTYLSVF